MTRTRTAPAGEPLGHRRDRPHHPDGWVVDRDEPAVPAWPGGKRPPLADNATPKETPR